MSKRYTLKPYFAVVGAFFGFIITSKSDSVALCLIVGIVCGAVGWVIGAAIDSLIEKAVGKGVDLVASGISKAVGSGKNKTTVPNEAETNPLLNGGAGPIVSEEAKEWRCRVCGVMNAADVAVCECGNVRPIKLEKPAHTEKKPTSVGNDWRCPKCGAVNAGYIGTCGCGFDKSDLPPEGTLSGAEEPVGKAENALNEFEKMKGYKEMLDAGIITQEEFDRKKAELLNL